MYFWVKSMQDWEPNILPVQKVMPDIGNDSPKVKLVQVKCYTASRFMMFCELMFHQQGVSDTDQCF